MSKRQKEWARLGRARMVALLGGKCACCGRLSNLQLDCIRPAGHLHHGTDPASRHVFYRRQMRAGNLQVLCARCNAYKGDHVISLPVLLELVSKANNSTTSCGPEGCEPF